MLHHDYAHIYIHNFIKLRNMILNLTFKKWKNQGSSEKKKCFPRNSSVLEILYGPARAVVCSASSTCVYSLQQGSDSAQKINKCNKVQTSASASHSHAAASSSAAP
jgi:hypothetical protein